MVFEHELVVGGIGADVSFGDDILGVEFAGLEDEEADLFGGNRQFGHDPRSP